MDQQKRGRDLRQSTGNHPNQKTRGYFRKGIANCEMQQQNQSHGKRRAKAKAYKRGTRSANNPFEMALQAGTDVLQESGK